MYRAHDTKLGRDVALKILPDTFAADPDRLARFEREARTLASLNHASIAQIYGVEEANGVAAGRCRAIVMELVDGEDLSVRNARGPIPLGVETIRAMAPPAPTSTACGRTSASASGRAA